MPPMQKSKLTMPWRISMFLGLESEDLETRIGRLVSFCSTFSEKPSRYITPLDCAWSSEGIRRTTVGGLVRAIAVRLEGMSDGKGLENHEGDVMYLRYTKESRAVFNVGIKIISGVIRRC